ncbi:hypothetical protein MLD38_019852 [Melastoma candidum]|uniref:Uncharacterized protein n=1 Tax=Melastoma candidum TaxID=119954 RepID=A0ACB9QC30_9MYRT|nr:hypothetical protein MLD38_019852 [Melastoma candidum]
MAGRTWKIVQRHECWSRIGIVDSFYEVLKHDVLHSHMHEIRTGHIPGRDLSACDSSSLTWQTLEQIVNHPALFR